MCMSQDFDTGEWKSHPDSLRFGKEVVECHYFLWTRIFNHKNMNYALVAISYCYRQSIIIHKNSFVVT